MGDRSPPSFEEWVDYCFRWGYADFYGFSGSPEDMYRERRYCRMDPATLTAYLTRLFESPAWLADRYEAAEIADATWFIFGIGSGYLGRVRHDEVSRDEQTRCIRAIASLYTGLFDRVCGRRGTDPDACLSDKPGVDGAVFMIWDMGHLEGTLLFPEDAPHLVEPAYGVLETALLKCRTSACRMSALHALGHIIGFHYRKTHVRLAERAVSLIDEFLQTATPPAWLCEYAQQARSGSAM